MIEEFHFWRPEKVKFVTRIVITILLIVFLVFVAYAWILYQQKVKISTMDSNHHPQSTPSSTSVDANGTEATNPADPSLSPMTVPANPN
jgi:hypothetical protein